MPDGNGAPGFGSELAGSAAVAFSAAVTDASASPACAQTRGLSAESASKSGTGHEYFAMRRILHLMQLSCGSRLPKPTSNREKNGISVQGNWGPRDAVIHY